MQSSVNALPQDWDYRPFSLINVIFVGKMRIYEAEQLNNETC